MQIIHSLHTVNWKHSHPRDIYEGWTHPLFFWSSWAYSALKALEAYGNISLITDSLGKSCIERLRIPYTSISTSLDGISLPSWLKNVHKLVSYTVPTEPFFHIHYDTFLLKRLPAYYENYSILVQSFDNITDCKEIHISGKAIIDRVSHRSLGWDNFKSCNKVINTGIFGGKDIRLIKEYSDNIFRVISQLSEPDREHLDILNCIIDGQLGYCFLQDKMDIISSLIPVGHNAVDAELVIEDLGFVHLMTAKYDYWNELSLLRKIHSEYPLLLEHIEKEVS